MSYPMTKMAPNHHHAHHFMLHGLPLEPVSRTYQYRKIMKPMLERKRRARINKCLDELKDLMTSTLQADGENLSKLEKADILELTVRHLHRLRETNGLFVRHTETLNMEKFWSGFQHCAVEVSHFLQKYDQQNKHANGDLIKYIANYVPNMAAAAVATATANGAIAATTTSPTAHIPHLQQIPLSLHTPSMVGGVGGSSAVAANMVNNTRNEHYQRFARNMLAHMEESEAITKIARSTTSATPKPNVATINSVAAMAHVRQQNLQQISASAASNFERIWEAAARAAATVGATATRVHPYGRKALSSSNLYNGASDEIVDVSGGDDENSCGFDCSRDGGGVKNCEYQAEDGGIVWRPW